MDSVSGGCCTLLYVSVWVPLWGCLCRQLMELTAVFRVVVVWAY